MNKYDESLKFTEIAVETYRNERNQRKLSELATTLTRIKSSMIRR